MTLLLAAAGSVAALLSAGGAWAGLELGPYDPSGGDSVLQQAIGVVYIAIVVAFFFRVFSKRAKFFTSARAGAKAPPPDGAEDEVAKYVETDTEPSSEPAQEAEVTPIKALIGAGQAAFIFTLLLGVCQSVDGYFDNATLPTQYTARNISLSVQTIVRGLSYLLCFLFGINALGMLALGVGLIVNPGGVDKESAPPIKRGLDDDLTLTSDPDAVRRAFERASAESTGKPAPKKEEGGPP